MNNKECIERLKETPRIVIDGTFAVVDYDHEAVDHAIAQLEKLDRLEELLDKAQNANGLNYEPYKNSGTWDMDSGSILFGQEAVLVAVRDFLTGDEKALKILAEVEE